MSLVNIAIRHLQDAPFPDFVTRPAIVSLVSEARSEAFVGMLGRMDIATDPATSAQALSDSLRLARRYRLSAYDAAYLELALRSALPIATLDDDLLRAAQLAGVVRFDR